MDIGLGVISKEFAVDRAAALVGPAIGDVPFLVNFGGDLYASSPRSGGRPWGIGVDDPAHPGTAALYRLELPQGGMATNRDARPFLNVNCVRMGHLLNPVNAWTACI